MKKIIIVVISILQIGRIVYSKFTLGITGLTDIFLSLLFVAAPLLALIALTQKKDSKNPNINQGLTFFLISGVILLITAVMTKFLSPQMPGLGFLQYLSIPMIDFLVGFQVISAVSLYKGLNGQENLVMTKSRMRTFYVLISIFCVVSMFGVFVLSGFKGD